jgi:hypothetical protein
MNDDFTKRRDQAAEAHVDEMIKYPFSIQPGHRHMLKPALYVYEGCFKAGWDACAKEMQAEIERLRADNLVADMAGKFADDRDRLAADFNYAHETQKRYHRALERIATTRCAWQLSQDIAREALGET